MSKIERITKILNTVKDYDSDVKQNVFIRIVEKVNLDNYPEETLLVLVRKMLRNEMVDQKIKEKRFDYVDADASEIDFLTFLADEEGSDIEEKTKALQTALKSLDEKEQELFQMVLQGHKNEFIAKQMGMNVNTLKSMRLRGIRKLKKIML